MVVHFYNTEPQSQSQEGLEFKASLDTHRKILSQKQVRLNWLLLVTIPHCYVPFLLGFKADTKINADTKDEVQAISSAQ